MESLFSSLQVCSGAHDGGVAVLLGDAEGDGDADADPLGQRNGAGSALRVGDAGHRGRPLAGSGDGPHSRRGHQHHLFAAAGNALQQQ